MDNARVLERDVQDRNGYWYSLRIHPYRTSDNRIDGVIVVLFDVDLIKRPLLEEVREGRDYAIALLESSGQAVLAAGADEKIVLINSRVEQMFGYRREEMMGQPLGMLLPESDRRRTSEDLRAFLAAPAGQPVLLGRDPSRNHLEGRRMDATTFPIEIRFSMIERAGRRLVVAFVEDLTERRRLENLSELYRAQVGSLAAQLIAAQEEERRRVSRELHDSLCQELASLAFDVEGLAAQPSLSAPVRSRLRSVQARAIKASEEARHIAYELHPSVLDDLGLVMSLKSLCDEFSKTEQVPARFTAGRVADSLPQEVASPVCIASRRERSAQRRQARQSAARDRGVSGSEGQPSPVHLR